MDVKCAVAKGKKRAKAKQTIKKVERKAKSAGKVMFWFFLARVAYVTGVIGFLPFVFLVSMPDEVWHAHTPNIIIGSVSALLIVIGVYSMYRFSKRDPAKMCKRLGRLTLIPALVTLLTFLFSEEAIIKVIDRIIPQLNSAENLTALLDIYMERVVPSMGAMFFGYLGIGGTLFWYGKKREKGPTFKSQGE